MKDLISVKVKILPEQLKAEHVKKNLKDTPALLPTFYVCPYADPNPGQGDDYDLKYFPPSDTACDINIAFITPNDNTTSGTFGNTISDQYLCHVRDRTGIMQLIAHMQQMGRRIITSYIDAPTIHWDKVNIENFVRNTEGDICADGTVLTNDLMTYYQPVGRMWDAETPTPQAMGEVLKACFLRGIQRDPDNYVFVYTTYANRDIDQIILNTPIDPNGSPVDQALYALGFKNVADFITQRGSLSFLETMSYGEDPQSRFTEADTYAIQLGGGDPSTLYAMRKFISIGVAPGLTAEADALVIAAACDPMKTEGYGRFMVWAGNSPDGVSLFNAMIQAQQQPVPDAIEPFWRRTGSQLAGQTEMFAMRNVPLALHSATAGNRHSLSKFCSATASAKPICPQFASFALVEPSVSEQALASKVEGPVKTERTWASTLTFGLL
jgi:hypothetical protein